MPNLRVAPRNAWDSATLSVPATYPTEVGSMLLTNTQSVRRGKVARLTTGGAGSGTVYRTHASWGGETRRANLFGAFRHNFYGGTVRLQLYSDAAWTTSVYDSTALSVDGLAPAGAFDWGDADGSDARRLDPFLYDAPARLFFAQQTFKSARVEITGITRNAYAECGRFWLANYFEVGINPKYGMQLGIKDNSEQDRTRGGSLPSDAGVTWRTLSCDLEQLTEAERALWLDVMARNGRTYDLVVSAFPSDASRRERDYMLDCKFVSLDPLSYGLPWKSKRLQLEEV
jgi:hypothetical protein